jgi:tRNA G18 (ribose-2'-O)-methylase SpoU
MKKLANSELERKTIKEFRDAEKNPFIIVLDNVRSLNNIGSVFRTCDAFLVEAVYLCGITGRPPHKDIHKTALGATESVKWEYFESTVDAVRALKNKGVKIISLEQVNDSISLIDFYVKKGEKYAVVLGHEIRGVDQSVVDISDYCIEIPQYGTKHSFNIAVSAGIVLWDLFNKYNQAEE